MTRLTPSPSRCSLSGRNGGRSIRAFTPPDQHSPETKDLLRLSDELVQEILAADHIAIGTPVYNYNVPAVLEAYIDHIVRKGLTLGFSGEGLIHGKMCTILMASGGGYSADSPIRDRDIATNYLRLILKAIGIEDVTVVAGGNAKSVDMGQTTREGFLQTFASELAAAAARTQGSPTSQGYGRKIA